MLLFEDNDKQNYLFIYITNIEIYYIFNSFNKIFEFVNDVMHSLN